MKRLRPFFHLLKNRVAPWIVLFFVVVALLSGFAISASAQVSTNVPAVQFGLVGLARLQTARINVLVPTPGPPDAPPNPIHVILRFLQDNGEPFVDRNGQPIVAEADLFPNQSAFLELPASIAFLNSRALRLPFRAVVEIPSPGPPELPPNPIVPTVEIYDNLTGRTSVLYIPSPGPPDVGRTNP